MENVRRKYIDSQYDDILETILAIAYVYFVAKNLFWFVEPWKERDNYIAQVVSTRSGPSISGMTSTDCRR
jgi:hypothetical protein